MFKIDDTYLALEMVGILISKQLSKIMIRNAKILISGHYFFVTIGNLFQLLLIL